MKESEIWYGFIHIIGKYTDVLNEALDVIKECCCDDHRVDELNQSIYRVFNEFQGFVLKAIRDGTLERIKKEWQELERERQKEGGEES